MYLAYSRHVQRRFCFVKETAVYSHNNLIHEQKGRKRQGVAVVEWVMGCEGKNGLSC